MTKADIDTLLAEVEERREVIKALYDTQMEQRAHRLEELDHIKTLITNLFEV